MNNSAAGAEYGSRESALLQFAAFFRDNPEAVNEDPARLAAQFGLPENMVREAIESAGHIPVAKTHQPTGFWTTLRRASGTVADAIGRNPHTAAVVAGFLWGFLSWVLGVFTDERVPPGRIVFVTFGIVALILINYLAGRARYALSTSAVMSAIVATMVVAMFNRSASVELTAGSFVLSVVLSVVNTTIGLSPLTFGAAFLGAYRGFLREEREEQRKDRLAHLQRVFALEEQLAEAESPDRPHRPAVWSAPPRALAFGRKNWLWLAIAAGAGYGLLTVVQAYIYAGRPAGIGNVWLLINNVFFAAAYVVLILAAGLFGGTWYKGIVAALCVVVFSGLVQLWNAPGWGLRTLIDTYSQPAELLMELVRIAAGGLAGLCSLVEERNRRLRRIAANDQSALLAEILRVRRILEQGYTSVCVLAADCAGSTEMKRSADPLAVEFSFREFHRYLEQTVRESGGSVQTTAGDSAIAQFSSSSAAFEGAKRILAGLPDFNREVNRLDLPFRLRIGLHCGKVHGGLREVQFSDVIDVASHLQKLAPVGGVALTEDAADGLPTIGFTDSGESVAGRRVLIPTEYATPASSLRML